MQVRASTQVRALTTATAFALLTPGALAAQQQPGPDLRTTPYVAAGYVANAPNIFTGGSVFATSARGFGLYVDVKANLDPPSRDEHFSREITIAQAEAFGDELFTTEEAWLSINLALVRPVRHEIALYAGAGYARRSAFREYVDPLQERGFEGFYWVRDEDASGALVNVLAGALLRLGRNVFFQLGGESTPAGATVGISYGLPRGGGF